MKSTTNVFLDGLSLDTHPLTTKNNQLTDALNATLRTYNGNELILQNDMGNTLIQDSTTGNIMGLRPGFIPIGMKEHGGILYIASYNLFTKEGELGTVPSPVFNYTYNPEPQYGNFSDLKLTNIDFGILSSILNDKFISTSFQVSDVRLQVGDLFIVCLDLDGTDVRIKRKEFINGKGSTSGSIGNGGYTKYYPVITKFKSSGTESSLEYGMFRVVLEAKTENNSKTVNLSDISNKRQVYYLEDSFELKNSDYWFIVNKEIENKKLDADQCELSDAYRTYPNIPPGYLYVHLEPELPENFLFPLNLSTNVHSPNFYAFYTKNEDYNKLIENLNPYTESIKACYGQVSTSNPTGSTSWSTDNTVTAAVGANKFM